MVTYPTRLYGVFSIQKFGVCPFIIYLVFVLSKLSHKKNEAHNDFNIKQKRHCKTDFVLQAIAVFMCSKLPPYLFHK